MSKLACILKAISEIRDDFSVHYSVHREPGNHYHLYYDCKETLQYTRPLNSRVWKAELATHGGTTDVVVKFTRTYFHEHMLEIKMVPQIYAEDELAGGWKVIVLEEVVGNTLDNMCGKLEQSTVRTLKEKLKSGLKILLKIKKIKKLKKKF